MDIQDYESWVEKIQNQGEKDIQQDDQSWVEKMQAQDFASTYELGP